MAPLYMTRNLSILDFKEYRKMTHTNLFKEIKVLFRIKLDVLIDQMLIHS